MSLAKSSYSYLFAPRFNSVLSPRAVSTVSGRVFECHDMCWLVFVRKDLWLRTLLSQVLD